jgi:pyruvate, water dikinase
MFALVGGKGANLGELTGAGLPVPPGFVVTATAYLDAVSESGARARLERLLRGLNADDQASLIETRKSAREEIMATTNPSGNRRGHRGCLSTARERCRCRRTVVRNE